MHGLSPVANGTSFSIPMRGDPNQYRLFSHKVRSRSVLIIAANCGRPNSRDIGIGDIKKRISEAEWLNGTVAAPQVALLRCST
jgi:hypothetical protein